MLGILSIILSAIGRIFGALFSWLTTRRKDTTITVRRFPSVMVIRAHFLGLTLGLLTTILSAIIIYREVGGPEHQFIIGCVVVVMIIGSYLGSVWPVVLASAWIFLGIFGFIPSLESTVNINVTSSLLLLGSTYLASYAFGYILGILYNDIVFVYYRYFRPKHLQIPFLFDPERKLNILKTPVLNEKKAEIERLVEDDRFRLQKMYQYHKLDAIPEHPYTIAFVANPFLKLPDGSYAPDPILESPDIFARTVDMALHSFESNEVLGRPEIWSRVRVIALFDDKLAKVNTENRKDWCLLQAYPPVRIDDQIEERLLDPVSELKLVYEKMLDSAPTNDTIYADSDEWDAFVEKLKRETDVIFAISAHPDYDRATSHFTDWVEKGFGFKISEKKLNKLDNAGSETEYAETLGKIKDVLRTLKGIVYLGSEHFIETVEIALGRGATQVEKEALLAYFVMKGLDDPNPWTDGAGKKYQFKMDPYGKKGEEINAVPYTNQGEIPTEKTARSVFDPFHEYYAKNPGRVAINVLTATEKTYIHEFAHAMSSAYHGAIVDEYFDVIEQVNLPEADWLPKNRNPSVRFMVTEETEGKLNSQNVDKDIVQQIMTLKDDDRIYGRDYFWKRVRELIDEDKIAQFYKEILLSIELTAPLYINRLEHVGVEEALLVPVPRVFAEYENTVFLADLDHPSSEVEWAGYFPNPARDVACTMDRNYGPYRFDRVIESFMYDRLIAKINRPAYRDEENSI